MLRLKDNTVYNSGKKIKSFEDSDDAESFMNALSMMEDEEDDQFENKQEQKLYTSINEFKKYLNNK